MASSTRKQSTRIFYYDNGVYREYKGTAVEGSINDITKDLGYHEDEAYTYQMPKNNSSKITWLTMEIFTRNVIFASTPKHVTYITDKDVKKALADHEFDFEFRPTEILNTLDRGINNQSLSIEFLSEVLRLNETADYGLFYSKKIKCYLQVSEGILTDFQYDDGLSTWARELRDANPTLYVRLDMTAKKYRTGDPYMSQREINIQCQAWASIPDASQNEFAFLHKQSTGAINYHMLMVFHYHHPISEQEFIDLNFGRFTHDATWRGEGRKYDCGFFSYQFDTQGELIDKAMGPK